MFAVAPDDIEMQQGSAYKIDSQDQRRKERIIRRWRRFFSLLVQLVKKGPDSVLHYSEIGSNDIKITLQGMTMVQDIRHTCKHDGLMKSLQFSHEGSRLLTAR